MDCCEAQRLAKVYSQAAAASATAAAASAIEAAASASESGDIACETVRGCTGEQYCMTSVTTEAELIAVNTAGVTGVFVAADINLTADLTVNVPISFSSCGIINTNGFLLTINSSITAGFYQILDTSASELAFTVNSNPTVIPQWFGAKGDDVTDDTAALQIALTVAGAANVKGQVYIPPGTYRNTGLTLPRFVILTGAGPKVSVLRYNPGTGNALSLQTVGQNNSFNTISNIKIAATVGSTGAGIAGAIDPLYVADLDIHNFEIEGFLRGIYIPYGLQIRISFGRLIGRGKAVANGFGLQLGDRTLGTPRLVNTAEVEGVYSSFYETNFVFDGSITNVHAVTSEECINAFLVATRLCITGSWIQADTFLFITRAGGWTIGGYSNYYIGGGVEVDNLVPWCNLADSAQEMSAFQKSEFIGNGRFRMRYATTSARGFQLGDTNPAYLYNASGSIRAEAVTRPFEINRDAAGAGLSLLYLYQQNVQKGGIGISSLSNLALLGGGSECIEWDANRNVAIGGGAVATNSTQGFLYVPTCAGTPTGVPAGKAGFIPIVVDSTNNKLYFYSGGAWRDAGP